MNIADRLKLAWAALTNRYEGAQFSGPNRTYLPAFLQDARFDADQMSRREMARKIRYFERNLWLVSRLREVYTKYTVGPNGMPVVPASSDDDWNKRMADAYAEWCESPGRDTLLPMSQLHRLMAGETHIDGEVFVILTNRKPDRGAQSVPAIQLIESHRVESPGDRFYAQESNIIDGVMVDSDSRPIAFYFREGSPETPRPRPAKEVIHVYDPERVGMYRAVTPYHAVLNTSHDLDDLEQFEMARAKANSTVANVIKTQSGEIPAATLQRATFSSTLLNNHPGTSASYADLAQRAEQYQKVTGVRTLALKIGEEIAQLDQKTPSAATQWLWQYKISQVCVAVNIPMMLVLPESVQGTVARAILDDAHQSFRAKFSVFETAARRIYRHFAEWARYNKKGLYDAPADWMRCHVIAPRACNVDYGRNSAAMLAELAAGVTNWDDIAGNTGTTAEQLIRKKSRNVTLIKRIAAEDGNDPAEISAPLADVVATLAKAEQAKAASEAAEQQKEQPEEVQSE